MKGRPTSGVPPRGCVDASRRPAAASETRGSRVKPCRRTPTLAGSARARLREMGPPAWTLLFEENLEAIETMREGLAARTSLASRMGASACRARLRRATARRSLVGPLLVHRLRGREGRGREGGQADPLAASPRQPRRGAELRELPLLPDRALRECRDLERAPRQLDPPLGIRPPRPEGHDRLRRRAASSRERSPATASITYSRATVDVIDVLPGLWGPKGFLAEDKRSTRKCGPKTTFASDLFRSRRPQPPTHARENAGRRPERVCPHGP